MLKNYRISKGFYLLALLVIMLSFAACSGGTPEPTQKHNYKETKKTDYSITGLPVFVDDISQCKDKNKRYVLPDGYIYEKKSFPKYSDADKLRKSKDTDGSVFNDCGYINNMRIRGTRELADSENTFVTGLIPAEKGDTIYFTGKSFSTGYEKAPYLNIVFYDSDKNVLTQVTMSAATEEMFRAVEKTKDGFISSMKVVGNKKTKKLAYIRFTLIGSGDNQAIGVNKEPVVTGNRKIWTRTEKYGSDEWFGEIRDTVEKVNSISAPEEYPLIKFMFAADIHADPDGKGSYTQNLGKYSAQVMSSCDIPFFITGGDNCTQSSEFTASVFKKNMKTLLSQLSPIPQKNILLAVGNHDGASGSRVYDGEEMFYTSQLTNEERSSVFFDWQRKSNGNKQFGADGTYYYMDDPSSKTRFIILNSFWSKWEGDEEGYVTDLEHSFFNNPLFGSEQLRWFAEEALDMPRDYGAVIVTHFASEAEDFRLFKGIVEAFNNRDVYKGSHKGSEEWQCSQVAVNYQGAYGEIIAVFQGHKHADAQYDDFEGIPSISMTTTGAYWDVKGEGAVERVKDTSSEFAVDAVVIDRYNRKIYMNRLGAGEDRAIYY